jgi:hypothetical protein
MNELCCYNRYHINAALRDTGPYGIIVVTVLYIYCRSSGRGVRRRSAAPWLLVAC